MKMVSQLMRQALARHRILSAGDAPTVPTPPRDVVPPQPPTAPPYVPTPPQNAPRPAHSSGIYQQLMMKHDRLNERHLKG